MKEKMNYISSGKAVPQDSFFAPLLAIPNILDPSTRHQAVFTKREANTEIMEMASQIRGFAARSIYRSEDRSMYDLGTGLEGRELDRDRGALESILQLESEDQESQDDDLVESSGSEIDESSSSSSHVATSQSADDLDESDIDLDEYNDGMNDGEDDSGDDDDDDQESDGFEDNEGGKQRLALLFDKSDPS